GLELDAIRAGALGNANQFKGLVDVAIVVDAGLGDDECWATIPHHAIGDLNRRMHADVLAQSRNEKPCPSVVQIALPGAVLLPVDRAFADAITKDTSGRRTEPAIDIKRTAHPPARRERLVAVAAAGGIGMRSQYAPLESFLHNATAMKTVGIENQQVA